MLTKRNNRVASLAEDIRLQGLTSEQIYSVGKQARNRLVKYYAENQLILEWGQILFPEKFRLPFCRELHEYLIDIRKKPLANTEAPRNHAKTTIKCFLIPIYQKLNEPNTYKHYLNVQATGSKAMSVNVSIRAELETNEDLISVYGEQIGPRWTDNQFVCKDGVIFTGIGAGQSIRGLNYRNVRPDYILVDDLYDEEDINNPDSTLKKNQWVWSSLYPARAKSETCCMHIQGTAINDEDLLEKLKKQDRWESRTFRAIKDDGSILWPELNTRESLEKDRVDMGSVIFDRELQNTRRSDSTSLIKRKWLQYYDPKDLKYTQHMKWIGTILCIDPSVGKKEENDFTGIALMFKTQYEDSDGCDWWIHMATEVKLSQDQRILRAKDIGTSLPRETPITDCRVECIAGFKDFGDELIRRSNLPVTIIDKVKDKITNREVKSKFFENGRVHINKFMDPVMLDTLVYQLTTNHPKHDDICDAVLLGLDSSSGLWQW